MTRNGIEYNLKISPYQYQYGDYTFYFSSRNYLTKFAEKLQEEQKIVSSFLSRKFEFDINADTLSVIGLYRKIEKRGFFITYKGNEFTCLVV